MGDIVDDAHGEMVFGLSQFQVFKHFPDMAGNDVLAADAAASAHDQGLPGLAVKGGFHIHIQWLGLSSQFFGPVEHGDRFDGGRDLLDKMGDRKRPV